MTTMIVLAITPDLNGIQAAFIGQELREVDANTSVPEWFRDEDTTFKSRLIRNVAGSRYIHRCTFTFNAEGFTIWTSDRFIDIVSEVTRGVVSVLDKELDMHVPISVSGSGEFPRSRGATFRFRKLQNMDVFRRWLQGVLSEIKKVKEAELNELAANVAVLDRQLTPRSRR